jgi:hypothetical protein
MNNKHSGGLCTLHQPRVRAVSGNRAHARGAGQLEQRQDKLDLSGTIVCVAVGV